MYTCWEGARGTIGLERLKKYGSGGLVGVQMDDVGASLGLRASFVVHQFFDKSNPEYATRHSDPNVLSSCRTDQTIVCVDFSQDRRLESLRDGRILLSLTRTLPSNPCFEFMSMTLRIAAILSLEEC